MLHCQLSVRLLLLRPLSLQGQEYPSGDDDDNDGDDDDIGKVFFKKENVLVFCG